jgi:hypothetical protein
MLIVLDPQARGIVGGESPVWGSGRAAFSRIIGS